MATNYKSTVKGVCWKQHTCVICNSVYKYRFERTGNATASTAVAAQQRPTCDHRAPPAPRIGAAGSPDRRCPRRAGLASLRRIGRRDPAGPYVALEQTTGSATR